MEVNAENVESGSIGIDFSDALDRMKSGFSMTRKGWNGKNMSVWIAKGIVNASMEIKLGEKIRDIEQGLFEVGEKGIITRLPNFNMVLADGCVLIGWIPTQTDLLSDDWIDTGRKAW